ncbi:MAG: phosphoribosylanthranilate isomerase [Planctomycetota bacterium]
MMFTKIKLCGFQDIESIYDALDQGVESGGMECDPQDTWRLGYFGLNLIERSPRRVSPDVAIDIAGQLLESDMTQHCDPVMLFADHRADQIVSAMRPLLDGYPDETWLIQLHGTESPEFVDSLPENLGVIKAVPFDPAEIDRWRGHDRLYGLLIDAPKRAGELGGGTGRTFDWRALSDLDRDALPDRLFLAGGLTPENVGEAIRTVRPYAVDVAGGVELSPGRKDPAKITAFCEAVRAADQEATP